MILNLLLFQKVLKKSVFMLFINVHNLQFQMVLQKLENMLFQDVHNNNYIL